jgi:hypothetical protein
MSTTLTIAINNTNVDQAYPTGTWITLVPGTDYLIFTNGNASVADGQSIPSSSVLGSAGMVLNGTQQYVPTYLLASVGAGELYQIKLMGRQNTQYVMAFSFSGATTSEPVLEAWDDTSLTTFNDVSLGAGTASNSWIHGITTTTGAPGTATWTGTPLAGGTNVISLNNGAGALSAAAVLYCNLFVVVPATQTAGGAETPVLVVKYTTT